MSAIEVFWGSGSQPSWSVLLTLELKRVPYTSRLLSFSAGDHKTPEFLQLNPRHRVPVIRDGAYVLSESVAIIAYLDKKFPEQPLFGRDAADAGRVWRAISEFQSYVQPALQDGVVRPIFFNKVQEKRALIDESLPLVHAELAGYDASLAARPWLVGDAISAADLLVYPQMMGLLRAATRPAAAELPLALLPFTEKYPNVAAWLTRFEALPGYQNTYPPHWR